MGEPAGISGEILIKAYRALAGDLACAFFAIADPEALRAEAARLGLPLAIAGIGAPAEAKRIFPDALPVLAERLPFPPTPGRLDPANAPAVVTAIERAVLLALGGEASGVVTCPIHKKTLYTAGFAHPGHTEYLAALCEREGQNATPVMMLACPGLRVVPVTIHCALAEVPRRLTIEGIVESGLVLAAALKRDFAIASPRIRVAGLNPHAGEGGAFGREEIEIVAPAIERLAAEGVVASGPYSADTLFHERARAAYDAALCMYHDQALIPLKTIDFDGGVNVTLGLPIVRTSPDHGVALDLAGKGEANPSSLIAAIRLAAEMARRRTAFRG